MMLNPIVIKEIEDTLHYHFQNTGLLTQAFTRSSFHNEHPDFPDNEVLEFIGDSVLALTVLTFFRKVYAQITEKGLLTDWNEGKLSALKNALVNKKQLAARMRQLGLQKYLLMSKGDIGTGIDREDSVLEDLFESIIGAIYVDSGENFAVTSRAVRGMLDLAELVEESQKKVHISYRNDLQEWCQNKQRGYKVPLYETVQSENGLYRAVVSVPECGLRASGEGKNTKSAMENAAKALLELQELQTAVQKESTPDANRPEDNAISRLQEFAQKIHTGSPVYTLTEDAELPDRSHLFTVSVAFAGKTASGTAANKKAAKKEAAAQLLKYFGL